MASTDARAIPAKNVAYRITFPILDADGDLVTGAAALDSEVSKDGGTFVDCTNEATELATASGMYYLDLTATEMNADTVAIIVKTTTTGAKTTPIVMYPNEAGDIVVNLNTDQLIADDGTDSTKLGHWVTLVRALADNSLTIISGVLRLKDRAGSGNVGRTLTVTGTVPSDTTRTAS